jgi:hypothetical protein
MLYAHFRSPKLLSVCSIVASVIIIPVVYITYDDIIIIIIIIVRSAV